jgi:hypothetical protein
MHTQGKIFGPMMKGQKPIADDLDDAAEKIVAVVKAV